MTELHLSGRKGSWSCVNVSHLLSPVYIAAVTGLVLNDHVLKQAMPGFVTGKLSDFLGLFAFAVFLSVLLPRWTLAVHVGTAVAFAAWKSPASGFLIQWWNDLVPFRIGRTVDYWDLTALVVLPVSMAYLRSAPRPILAPRKAVSVLIAAGSLFAFAATSRPPDLSTLNAGKEASASGEYQRAIQLFDEAAKDQFLTAEALHHRGVAKLKMGDTAGGEADIAKAASMNPRFAPVPPAQCSGSTCRE